MALIAIGVSTLIVTNLPYSLENVKQICNNCSICQEVKPQTKLSQHNSDHASIRENFKVLIPSEKHPYPLTIVDEYSQFPFGYPVSDTSAQTAIRCFTDLFSVFVMSGYVHSDRGIAFMSTELREWLFNKGIAASRTTPYKLNSTIWKLVLLSLKTRTLPVSSWEIVLLGALHSVRSLLCTSTNATPRERLFNYERCSATGTSIPSWLLNPRLVLVQRNNRTSKYDPIADQVDLIEVNPQ
ncbi:uncharacterized protein LOC106876699 [Octopus bimaculoides]|uniref:uncharacterized protein LOC106876699 n=1 Tax=Octopus bimaculoides TaxID=37653 RepID=UPI00071E1238|nr:uncharacterized protein LOC106876699 [Octopus bimaculoides]|eukprot:XP_014780845.1 PREDICTED: uncharacterized protein LOC106876699 [Octopus bimaculoides]